MIPWYIRTGTLFRPVVPTCKKPDGGYDWIAHVWIVTGWRWASWLLRRR